MVKECARIGNATINLRYTSLFLSVLIFRRHDVPDDFGMQKVIRDKLLPDFHSLLAAKDPLPAYAVRLLDTLLEHWPRYFDQSKTAF